MEWSWHHTLSSAAVTPGTALGYADNSVWHLTTFEKQPVTNTAAIVKYSWLGDANLDGQVTGADLDILNNGQQNHLTGWYNGDFNYDGVINADDYALSLL